MKKLFTLLSFLFLIFFILPENANGLEGYDDCSPFSPIEIKDNQTSATFNIGPTTQGSEYAIEFNKIGNIGEILKCNNPAYTQIISAQGGSLLVSVNKDDSCKDTLFETDRKYLVYLYESDKGQRRERPICVSKYQVSSSCTLAVEPQSVDTTTNIVIKGNNVPENGKQLRITGPGNYRPDPRTVTKTNGSFTESIGRLDSPGNYPVQVLVGTFNGVDIPASCPILTVRVGQKGKPIDNQPPPRGKPGQPPKPFQPETCGPDNKGLQTAVGCIPIQNTNEFAAWFLKWAIGIAGGIAFLLIVFSAFQIMTASGNPEKLQGGREMLTSAIAGLILIIFSVFLLRLIGVEILQIPGFSK